VALLALGLASSGLGCAKFQTVRECGAFVEAIKAWKAQSPKGAASATALPSSPAAATVESLALAERYDDLAIRIDSLLLRSPDLVPQAVRYQKLAREAAAALREVAAAVAKGDAEGARKRRVQFDDIASGEARLVADINAICR
jgi:hypothetical protein